MPSDDLRYVHLQSPYLRLVLAPSAAEHALRLTPGQTPEPTPFREFPERDCDRPPDFDQKNDLIFDPNFHPLFLPLFLTKNIVTLPGRKFLPVSEVSHPPYRGGICDTSSTHVTMAYDTYFDTCDTSCIKRGSF